MMNRRMTRKPVPPTAARAASDSNRPKRKTDRASRIISSIFDMQDQPQPIQVSSNLRKRNDAAKPEIVDDGSRDAEQEGAGDGHRDTRPNAGGVANPPRQREKIARIIAGGRTRKRT